MWNSSVKDLYIPTDIRMDDYYQILLDQAKHNHNDSNRSFYTREAACDLLYVVLLHSSSHDHPAKLLSQQYQTVSGSSLC